MLKGYLGRQALSLRRGILSLNQDRHLCQGATSSGQGLSILGARVAPYTDSIDDVTVDQIMDKAPRAKIREYTAQDPTLAFIRSLADKDSEGYEWNDGIIFRHRLD